MAFTRVEDGCRLHYQVVGRSGGDPVLLIQGLGADMTGWTFQRLALAPRYRLPTPARLAHQLVSAARINHP